MKRHELFEKIYNESKLEETNPKILISHILGSVLTIDKSIYKDTNSLYATYLDKFSKVIKQLHNLRYETQNIDGVITIILNGENHLYSNTGNLCNKETFEKEFLENKFLKGSGELKDTLLKMLKMYLDNFDDNGLLIIQSSK